jgi:hypothetical protein
MGLRGPITSGEILMPGQSQQSKGDAHIRQSGLANPLLALRRLHSVV